jgi:hypothetical protein
VPLVCDGVALAKENVAEVRAAVGAKGFKSRALSPAVHVAFVAGPEACSGGLRGRGRRRALQ